MLRRFLLGGLSGALLGGGVGAAYASTLKVPMTPTFALLAAMATSALVVVLVRRPIWRQESAVETLLRTILGIGLGAALWFLARRVADPVLPIGLPPFHAGLTLVEHAWLFPLLVGFLTGLIVGVEDPPPRAPKAEPARAPAETLP